MQATDKSILATLAYYGALRRPLSVVDLYERLIPAERFGEIASRPTLGDIATCVDSLVQSGSVHTECGMYVSSDVIDGFGRVFIERQKEAAQKFQKLLKSAWWLQCVPFVRALCASGSLALGATGASADWDVFVIAQEGRLYTTRFGLLGVAWVMRRLRTKRMRTAPDRFCFNHLITTDGLSLKYRSLFMAHAMAWLIPLYDPFRYVPRLRQANQWVSDYVADGGGELFVRRAIATSKMLQAVRRCAEAILATPLGDGIEALLRRWMQSRIAAEPATHQAGGRVVADRRTLEFHPRSFEATALARYNISLGRYGLGAYTERDSGLKMRD